MRTGYRNFELILEAAGGADGLRRHHLKLQRSGYQDLVVESVDTWPEGELVSFAHYFEQYGDMMRDPEIVFLVTPAGWFATECTQDPMGGYTRCMWREGSSVLVSLGARSSVEALARVWNRNLDAQGWVADAHQESLRRRAATPLPAPVSVPSAPAGPVGADR